MSTTHSFEAPGHRGVPNHKARRIGAVVLTGVAMTVAAEAGNHFAHQGSEDYSNVPAHSSVEHPKTPEELAQLSQTDPNKVEAYNLAPGMTAGGIAEDLAKKGYYYELRDEVKEQQDGAVLADHGQVMVETRLLKDPNAQGLHEADSGS